LTEGFGKDAHVVAAIANLTRLGQLHGTRTKTHGGCDREPIKATPAGAAQLFR